MKLKLSLILVCGTVSICALSACGPTKEEKAQKMAADYLNGILYHSDSYEPLQTKVDSSFVALSSDKEAIEQTFNMLKLIYLTYEYAAKIESAEESMEIWYPDGYSSRHSKGQYRRAKEDRDNYQHLLDKTKDRIRKQFDKIKKRQSDLDEGAFDGWKVYHRYKSLNGSGTVSLSREFIFFCDEQFNVTSAYSKDDYDIIVKIMTAISISEDTSEMIEKIRNEIY